MDILLSKNGESPLDPCTTFNTLQTLGFDKHDILSQLLALDIAEYLETFIDDKDPLLPPFYAFGKTMKNHEVYIKVKIRNRERCKVFCVSFHFARYPFPHYRPYA
ncbi:MAG TPA: hypothetical protein DF409_16290 [Bacteroidales bacterium]|nr:hypothetical protein [Bacteroidales bacterium]